MNIVFIDGFAPSQGQSFHLFNGVTNGAFNQVNLPFLGSGLAWDTSNLLSSGVLAVVPEPGTGVLLVFGIGFLGRRFRSAGV